MRENQRHRDTAEREGGRQRQRERQRPTERQGEGQGWQGEGEKERDRQGLAAGVQRGETPVLTEGKDALVEGCQGQAGQVGHKGGFSLRGGPGWRPHFKAGPGL